VVHSWQGLREIRPSNYWPPAGPPVEVIEVKRRGFSSGGADASHGVDASRLPLPIVDVDLTTFPVHVTMSNK
jgi:hypothetical protein